MAKLVSNNLQVSAPSANTTNNDKIVKIKSNVTACTGRHAAEKLPVNDYIDLTDDHRCFICDKVITRAFYSLAKTVTNTSKIHVAQKLGELMGKSYIVVVADDDYICQSCVNLFNQLDNLEMELLNVRNNIMKNLEHTYLHTKKISNTLPNHIYTSLQSLVNQEKEDCSPAKKKKYSEIQSSLGNYLIRKPLSFAYIDQNHCSTTDLNKENVVNNQSTAQNFRPSNVLNHVNVPDYLLSSVNDTVPVANIKIENEDNSTLVEPNMDLSNTKISTYDNSIHYIDHFAQPIDFFKPKEEIFLTIPQNPVQPTEQVMLFTEEGLKVIDSLKTV